MVLIRHRLPLKKVIWAQPYNHQVESDLVVVSNPLILHHERLGAQLDASKTPLSYSDPIEEYWAVKKAAGIADISNAGRLRITGKDRVSFLNGLLTSDVAQLREDGGQHSALLNPKARILADLYLYGQPDGILVDTGDSPASKVKEALDRFVITEDVQIRDATQDRVQITIQGPRSGQAIREALGVELEGLKPLGHKVLGPSTIVSRDRSGQGGYDIILPNEEAEAVWNGFLLKTGDIGLRPIGSKSMEMLRLEAGYPRYGIDIDDNTIVLEAGFRDAISFTKGCYMGQEVVARATHIGRVNKQLVRLEIEARDPPSARSKLKSNDVEAGFITSAAFSPGLGRVACLAYANRDFAKEGTRLAVEQDDGPISAVVTKVL
ncbi:aminomethyl transferase family protein [Candidatus Bathyarchaeota archaeon]|nr:MAG: aminomethyl transferase family protein [Candidatus Bathyarchaeota archaeon]